MGSTHRLLSDVLPATARMSAPPLPITQTALPTWIHTDGRPWPTINALRAPQTAALQKAQPIISPPSPFLNEPAPSSSSPQQKQHGWRWVLNQVGIWTHMAVRGAIFLPGVLFRNIPAPPLTWVVWTINNALGYQVSKALGHTNTATMLFWFTALSASVTVATLFKHHSRGELKLKRNDVQALTLAGVGWVAFVAAEIFRHRLAPEQPALATFLHWLSMISALGVSWIGTMPTRKNFLEAAKETTNAWPSRLATVSRVLPWATGMFAMAFTTIAVKSFTVAELFLPVNFFIQAVLLLKWACHDATKTISGERPSVWRVIFGKRA